eukprot:EG_transcript_2405
MSVAPEPIVETEGTNQPNGLANLRYPGVFIQKKKRSSMAYRTHSNAGSCSSVDSLESPGATDSRAGACDSPMSSESQSPPVRAADQLGVHGEGNSEQGLCIPLMEPSAKLSFVGQRTSNPRTYVPNPELRPQPPSPPTPVRSFHAGCIPLPPPPLPHVPGTTATMSGAPPPYPPNRFAAAGVRRPPPAAAPPAGACQQHSPYGSPPPGVMPAPQFSQPQGPGMAPALFPGLAPQHYPPPMMVGPQVVLRPTAPRTALPPHTYVAPPPPLHWPAHAAPASAPVPFAAPASPGSPPRPPVPHSKQLLDSLAQLHASAANVESIPPVSPIVPELAAHPERDLASPAAVLAPEEGAVVMLQKVMENSNAPDEKAAVDPRKYKTRMCRNWLEHGECVYAHTCCFAHGPEELRTLVDNHKTLASIGYFSNVVLLAMTNGKKPALPPHSLYQQEWAASVPQEWAFPFRDPLPAALKDLGPADASGRRKGHRGKAHRNFRGTTGGRARGGPAAPAAGPEDSVLGSEVTA